VFNALTTARPYKRPQASGSACEELLQEAARGWHRRDLVEAFVTLQGAA
jgi:response regulator RpfG family c-di-GMP phosphodiesterase